MNQKVIDKLNKYFENKIYDKEFEVFGLPLKLSFKFQIIGEKEKYWLGEPYPTLGVKVILVDYTDWFSKLLTDIKGKPSHYFITNFPEINYPLTNEIKDIIKVLADYSVEIDDVENLKNKKNITEVKKYDKIIDKIVDDIIDIVKLQEEGDFLLPEDVDGNMTYQFINLDNEFDVDVQIEHDETINDFIIDGGYYSDEDKFEFLITYNPKKYPSFLVDFTGEINEVVAHEFNHMLQDMRGELGKPGGEFGSLEYYLQYDELESQYEGFKRHSRVTKIPMKIIVRNWFNKYGEERGLSEEDQEVLIHAILNFKKK